MKNILLKRINNSDFTIRLCVMAKKYNFKTIGKLRNFCINNTTYQLSPWDSSRSIKRIREEVEKYIEEHQNK